MFAVVVCSFSCYSVWLCDLVFGCDFGGGYSLMWLVFGVWYGVTYCLISFCRLFATLRGECGVGCLFVAMFLLLLVLVLLW